MMKTTPLRLAALAAVLIAIAVPTWADKYKRSKKLDFCKEGGKQREGNIRKNNRSAGEPNINIHFIVENPKKTQAELKKAKAELEKDMENGTGGKSANVKQCPVKVMFKQAASEEEPNPSAKEVFTLEPGEDDTDDRTLKTPTIGAGSRLYWVCDGDENDLCAVNFEYSV